MTNPSSSTISVAAILKESAERTPDKIAIAELKPVFAAQLARWDAATGGLELDVANRLFGEKTVAFAPAFLETTKTTFAAPLELLDFAGASGPAREHINGWVAETTHSVSRLPPARQSWSAQTGIRSNAVSSSAKA